ncbi:uncharacterized protein LOC143908934 [Arctopsyche grandis]|uniref:uncharacterized protein LOC143908934 n=1 Tax=Arctopsyche grandis TaxID=121162 RepID=UPI00406D7DA8
MGTSPGEKPSETMTITDDTKPSEEFQWSVENEVHLFHAMIGNKPAGVNKHFHMASVCEKFSQAINKEVTSECIWKFLEELYNFEVLDDIEGVPFPNDEKDFILPEFEYGTLMRQKMKDIIHKVEDAEDRSASPRTQTISRSVSRGAASKENTTKSTTKKEHTEKTSKSQSNKDANTTQHSVDSSSTPSKALEKDSTKSDSRRDSKDSTSSNKDASKTPSSASKSTKENKVQKSSRSSIAEKLDESMKSLDDSNAAKRGNKRSTRGSLKSEEPTPPSRRRRI